ncbi:MAG: hypothetical protein R3F34_17135 [Planctomycetota bacterium]
MSRSFVALLVAAAALVAILLVFFGPFAPSFDVDGRGEEHRERGPLGDVELADEHPAANGEPGAAPSVADALGTVPTGGREALVAATEEPERPLVVRGQVLDAYGSPAAGVAVRWYPADPDRAFDAFVEAARSNGPGGPGPSIRVDPVFVSSDGEIEDSKWEAYLDLGDDPYVYTDETGWFEFPWSDARVGGTIAYGVGLFANGAPRAPVDEQGRDHYLRLPARGANAPRLVVELTAKENGDPIFPSFAEIEALHLADPPADVETLPESLTSRGHYRLDVDPRQILRQQGVLRVDSLAPGSWRLRVRGDSSEFVDRTVTMPFDGDDVVVRLELATYDGAWTSSALAGDTVDDLVPDASTGFADYPGDPAKWRPLEDRSANKQFLHTVRGFGTGPFSAAVLEIDLEAVPDACWNDSIALEFLGERRFAWNRRISDLAGGNWNVGRRERLFLDLAKLPTDGAPLDLLASLADGALDVYVQDDTVVHALSLHVVP